MKLIITLVLTFLGLQTFGQIKAENKHFYQNGETMYWLKENSFAEMYSKLPQLVTLNETKHIRMWTPRQVVDL